MENPPRRPIESSVLREAMARRVFRRSVAIEQILLPGRAKHGR